MQLQWRSVTLFDAMVDCTTSHGVALYVQRGWENQGINGHPAHLSLSASRVGGCGRGLVASWAVLRVPRNCNIRNTLMESWRHITLLHQSLFMERTVRWGKTPITGISTTQAFLSLPFLLSCFSLWIFVSYIHFDEACMSNLCWRHSTCGMWREQQKV